VASDAQLLDVFLTALGAGDLETLAPLLTDDAEYVNPPYAMESGTRRGRDAVLSALEALSDTFELTDVATTHGPVGSGGTRRLVVWKGPMRMRRFDAPLPNDGALLVDREGDRIARIAWFRDVEEAHAAAD
jgi:ketosteroid isomerase-like protein